MIQYKYSRYDNQIYKCDSNSAFLIHRCNLAQIANELNMQMMINQDLMNELARVSAQLARVSEQLAYHQYHQQRRKDRLNHLTETVFEISNEEILELLGDLKCKK